MSSPFKVPERTFKLMKINEPFDSLRTDLLVVSTQKKSYENKQVLFCTVSPPPNLKIRTKVAKRQCVRRYDELPQGTQLDFCLRLIEHLYLPYCSKGELLMTWELNKSGNVHIHMLIYDEYSQNDYSLHLFRRSIKADDLTRRILGTKSHNDYMNNIVICNDVAATIEYMCKDQQQRIDLGLPNFYISKFN